MFLCVYVKEIYSGSISFFLFFLVAPPVELEEDLDFEVQPVASVDQEMTQVRSKVFPMVKVLWRNYSIEEMTWKTEASMRNHYPYLFEV